MEVEWLKRSYSEAPVDGLDMKRVKFLDILEALTIQFPPYSGSAQLCSAAIQAAFPNARRKRVGKERHHYILGITPVSDMEGPSGERSDRIEALSAENEQLRLQVQQLQAQLAEHRSDSVLSPRLAQQCDAMLQHGSQIIYGPDTPVNFREFSLECVMREMHKNAPDVYSLFLQLGATDRNASEEETSAEQIKAVMSLCTLLNARSQLAKGMQLLLSFMLIARATSKQVNIKCESL